MRLTPVKIRGKKRQVSSIENDSLSKQLAKSSVKRQKTKPNMKKTPLVPAVLRLPTEILERILIFSENPSFAHVTPPIGVMLSGKMTLMEFVIAAFAPTWNDWFGPQIQDVESYPEFSTDAARIAGDPVFQTAVLACPWATSSLILDAQQLWLSRATRRPMDGSSLTLAEEYFIQEHSSRSVTNDFNDQLEHYRDKPGDKCFLHLSMSDYRRRRYHIQVHPQTAIPDTLFLAPFTHAKVEFLEWLVIGNARLQPSQTWELTLQGFHDLWAMTGDLRLKLMYLDLFIRLDIFVQWPMVLREQTQKYVLCEPGALADRHAETHTTVLDLGTDLTPYLMFPDEAIRRYR